jgi:hypothetical protein
VDRLDDGELAGPIRQLHEVAGLELGFGLDAFSPLPHRLVGLLVDLLAHGVERAGDLEVDRPAVFVFEPLAERLAIAIGGRLTLAVIPRLEDLVGGLDVVLEAVMREALIQLEGDELGGSPDNSGIVPGGSRFSHTRTSHPITGLRVL